MKKRFTFKCWNCSRTYTLLREITTAQKITVACPYCLSEAVVDLAPFLKEKRSSRLCAATGMAKNKRLTLNSNS
ncbi:MAG: hypothetical protein IPN96_02315 [Anaerolineales bacterium]|nr:hypothetical protein [Anaerolineales bacterium]